MTEEYSVVPNTHKCVSLGSLDVGTPGLVGSSWRHRDRNKDLEKIILGT